MKEPFKKLMTPILQNATLEVKEATIITRTSKTGNKFNKYQEEFHLVKDIATDLIKLPDKINNATKEALVQPCKLFIKDRKKISMDYEMQKICNPETFEKKFAASKCKDCVISPQTKKALAEIQFAESSVLSHAGCFTVHYKDDRFSRGFVMTVKQMVFRSAAMDVNLVSVVHWRNAASMTRRLFKSTSRRLDFPRPRLSQYL